MVAAAWVFLRLVAPFLLGLWPLLRLVDGRVSPDQKKCVAEKFLNAAGSELDEGVGPRPVVSEELVQYGALASAYMQHRPGLTGPWQIGERSDTSFETRVKLDAQYMDSWTLIDDMRIAAKTAKMILSGRSNGAY